MFGLPVKKKKRVYLDAEMKRIAGLPRRSSELPGQGLTESVSAMLRAPGSTATLFPIQAKALLELDETGGILAPITVGGGKTLISLLAPVVLGSKKPLLIAPASLLKKTAKEIRHYARDWKIARVEMVSYERLARASCSDFLAKGGYDLLIFDEAHRLKNKRTSVTKRTLEYRSANPDCRFVMLSGTFTNRSLKDYSHLSTLCLGAGSPVPSGQALESWSAVLDAKAEEPEEPITAFSELAEKPNSENDEQRIRDLHVGTFIESQQAARELYRQRLIETPGVISFTGASCDASIYLEPVEYKLGSAVSEALGNLRAKNELPGGRDLMSQLEVWTKGQEMSLGFFHYWDPMPPFEWREYRKEWARFCRQFLNHSKKITTPNQLALEIKAGRVQCPEYHAWKRVEKDFVPVTHSEWISNEAIQAVEANARKERKLVWSPSKTFAKRLARETGMLWFGAGGLSDQGLMIEDYDGSESVIVSARPNLQGRNLQTFDRNLICGILPTASDWEQLIGRTHRSGQQSDEIEVSILCGSADQVRLFDEVRKKARYVEETMNYQKLISADDNYPLPEDVHDEDNPIWDCRIGD